MRQNVFTIGLIANYQSPVITGVASSTEKITSLPTMKKEVLSFAQTYSSMSVVASPNKEQSARSMAGFWVRAAGVVGFLRSMVMKSLMQQGSGSPKFCWHCSKQLQRAKGKGLGLFYFRIVVDQDGNEHRVHGDCLKMAIGDGVKALAQHET